MSRHTHSKKATTPNIDDRQQQEYKRILEDLLKLEENKYCADCKKAGPKWASVTLGIFLCLDCAGLHRNLGVHISFIRSTTLDTWKPEQVENMRNMGNRKSNEIYESNIPSDYPKPGPGDKIALGNWIRQKYVDKRFARRNESSRSKTNNQQGNTSQPITRRETENVRGGNEEFEPFNNKPNQNQNQNNQNANQNAPLVLTQTNNFPDLFGGPSIQNQGINNQNQNQNQGNINQNQNQGNNQNQRTDEKKSLNDVFMKMFEDQKNFSSNPNPNNQPLPNLFGEPINNQQQGQFNNQQGFNQGFNQQQRVNYNQQFGNNQGFNNQQQFNNGNGQFNQQGFNQQYGNNQGFGNQGYNQQFGNQGFNNQQQFNNGNGQQFNQGFNQGYNQQQFNNNGGSNFQMNGQFGNNQGQFNNQQQFNNGQFNSGNNYQQNTQNRQGNTQQNGGNLFSTQQQNTGFNNQTSGSLFGNNNQQSNYTSLFA